MKYGKYAQRALVSAFLAFALVSASLAGTIANSAAQESHTASSAILKGSIASVQLDDEGNPEWIQSGIWVLRLAQDATDSDMSAHLVVRMTMVMANGNAVHSHALSDYALANASLEGNTTRVLEGTSTVTMREGPVSDVPLTIRIFNNAVIAMWIGPELIDSHFGTGPVYGTLSESSRSAMTEMHEGMTMDEMPDDTATTELERSDINYYGNATGYMVQPAGETNLPAVIVIHEWWGLNDHIKDAADRLASEGYVVLAADLYSGEVAEVPDRARELAGAARANPEEAVVNLNAAVEYVSSLPDVDSSRVAALGWCFGGGFSMQLALNAEQPLAATVIYYGTLVTDPEELSVITWPVLGVFGSADQSIPVETVNQFEDALDARGITNEIYIYEGVGHAFANPSGDNYAPEETADAWDKTLAFLEEYV